MLGPHKYPALMEIRASKHRCKTSESFWIIVGFKVQRSLSFYFFFFMSYLFSLTEKRQNLTQVFCHLCKLMALKLDS